MSIVEKVIATVSMMIIKIMKYNFNLSKTLPVFASELFPAIHSIQCFPN